MHLIAKNLLQIFGIRLRAFGECAAAGKTTIGGDQMQIAALQVPIDYVLWHKVNINLNEKTEQKYYIREKTGVAT